MEIIETFEIKLNCLCLWKSCVTNRSIQYFYLSVHRLSQGFSFPNEKQSLDSKMSKFIFSFVLVLVISLCESKPLIGPLGLQICELLEIVRSVSLNSRNLSHSYPITFPFRWMAWNCHCSWRRIHIWKSSSWSRRQYNRHGNYRN